MNKATVLATSVSLPVHRIGLILRSKRFVNCDPFDRGSKPFHAHRELANVLCYRSPDTIDRIP